MGIRLTPVDSQPFHCSDTFKMQATSAESNVASVASYLGMPVKVLTAFVKGSPVSHYIKDNLNPYPANAFAAGPDGVSIGGRQAALRPDVLIVLTEQGSFEVEVIESRRFQLKVNPVYRQLVGELQPRRPLQVVG